MDRFSNFAGAFEISSMAGQPQVAICHSFFVTENLRGKGYSHRLKKLQAQQLSARHYDFALCTVAAGNIRQKKALSRAGWEKLSEFSNTRQSEMTEIWGLAINPNALEEASGAAA